MSSECANPHFTFFFSNSASWIYSSQSHGFLNNQLSYLYLSTFWKILIKLSSASHCDEVTDIVRNVLNIIVLYSFSEIKGDGNKKICYFSVDDFMYCLLKILQLKISTLFVNFSTFMSNQTFHLLPFWLRPRTGILFPLPTRHPHDFCPIESSVYRCLLGRT